MESKLGEYRKSLSTLSSGVVESLSSDNVTSWQGAGSSSGPPSPKMNRAGGASSRLSSVDSSPTIAPTTLLAATKPFSAQSVREIRIQTQTHLTSDILKHLEMEMSQSPQATILRRMREASRNEEGDSSTKLEDERIVNLEQAAKSRELEYLLTEEVPLTISDTLSVLTGCLDDLKGDTEEQIQEAVVRETMEEQKERLRKKVASNLDSMLKYGSSVKSMGREKDEEEERTSQEEEKKGPKRTHLLEFKKKTDEGVSSLRGFAAITGWRIYKSEFRLDVKPTWSKKMPFVVQAQVSYLTPLLLPQIQNAYNYIRTAIGELGRLQRQVSEGGGTNERNVVDALQRIKDQLRMAREELVTVDAHEFPDNMFVTNTSGFLPTLPHDVVVEFHVFNAQLILSVYILQISQMTAKMARESQGSGAVANRGRIPKSRIRQTPTVGQTFVVQGKKVEIMDAIRLPFDVPALKTVVHALEQATDLTNDLRDKLLAVSP